MFFPTISLGLGSNLTSEILECLKQQTLLKNDLLIIVTSESAGYS